MRETKKNIAVLAILNIIIFGLFFYLFISIRQSDEDVSTKLVQIKRWIDRDERLQSVKNLMSETKDQREKIAKIFVQADGSVDFIETVESLGKAAGVKVEIGSVGIDASRNKIGSSTESFRFSVKTEGGWANVIHLLGLLESMPFKVSFDNVALSKISISEEPSLVKNKDKPQDASNWSGNFDFSVLKVKSLPQPLKN
jgi:hypothetical protein